MTTAPHAYSSETLQKAYKWLQNNPQHQKEINNSDQLVSVYLSEKKGLQSFSFSPSDSTNLFLNKNTNQASINNISGSGLEVDSLEVGSLEVGSLEVDSLEVDSLEVDSLEVGSDLEVGGSKNVGTDSFFALDKKSLSYLEDTKKTFNLSTQSEALRLLVSIGHEKLHKI